MSAPKRLLADAVDAVLSVWDWLADSMLGLVLAIVAVTLLVVSPLLGGLYYYEKRQCQEQATAMEREWRYGFFSECLVRTDGGAWVPLDNYRLTHEESGR